ncbi:MerC domain-containing protein [Sphingomonas sp. LR59]
MHDPLSGTAVAPGCGTVIVRDHRDLESFHRWVLLFAAPVAVVALLGGNVSHKAPLPLGLGLIGIVLMTIGAFALQEGAAEIAMTVAGSVLVATAHIINLRLRHSSCTA